MGRLEDVVRCVFLMYCRLDLYAKGVLEKLFQEDKIPLFGDGLLMMTPQIVRWRCLVLIYPIITGLLL